MASRGDKDDVDNKGGNSIQDKLKSVHKWMKEIKNDMESDVEQNMLPESKKAKIEKILKQYRQSDRKHRKLLGDRLAEDGAVEVLTKYFKVMRATKSPTKGYNAECLKIIRLVFLNYSYSSLDFRLQMGPIDLFSDLVADLHALYDDENANDAIVTTLGIIHNCARSSDNRRLLKEENAIDAIRPYTRARRREAKVLSLLILAYLIDESDNEEIATSESMIKSILGYLRVAIENDEHCDGEFSAEEIINGLRHLANNEDNGNIIVNKGILPILSELLEKANTSEKIAIARLVWLLSFSDENKEKIRQEENLMVFLNEAVDSDSEMDSGEEFCYDDSEDDRFNYTSDKENFLYSENDEESDSDEEGDPDDDVADLKKGFEGAVCLKSASTADKGRHESFALRLVKTVAEGALWLLKDHQSLVTFAQPSSPKHIMISYQWKYQNAVMKIKKELEENNYRVWVDIENMTGFILDTMAKAVENSEVVIICVSETYKNSENCRIEANYVFKLKKCFVPIRLEKDYVPDGWLGALEGGKLYIDFTDNESFDSNISKLIKELGDKGKGVPFSKEEKVDTKKSPKK